MGGVLAQPPTAGREAAQPPPDEPPLTPRTRRLLFLESFLGNFLFTLCMITGVKLTTAVSAGVILAAIPAAVAVLSWLFLRERVAPRVWAGVACAVLGIALVALSKQELPAPFPSALAPSGAAHLAWLGNLLLIGAVLCEASYAVIGKSLTASLSPLCTARVRSHPIQSPLSQMGPTTS